MVVAALAGNVAGVQAQVGQGQGFGKPLFTKIPLNGSVHPGAITIPYWSSSFSFGGKTYPYTMTGTNPFGGGGSTTVPIEIIPLSFTFSTGQALDASTKTASTVASPIFQSAGFSSGNTQYGDAIMRAEFWTTGGNSSTYHVLLGQPAILATQHINVPQNQGQVRLIPGTSIGLIDINWFSAQLQQLLGQLRISPTTLPIFLTYNTVLSDPKNGCCVLGYHGAAMSVGQGTGSANGNGAQPIQTFIYAVYAFNPNHLGGSDPQNTNSLSHEISEWLNDPFANNSVPNWYVSANYGCSNALETGDPLVGTNFTVNSYYLQDEALFSWFAHEVPSRAQNGLYSYLGTFTSPPAGC